MTHRGSEQLPHLTKKGTTPRNNTFGIGDPEAGVTLSFDETNPHGLLRLDTPELIYFLSASETLTLLQWLWERRETIYQMSQQED